MRYGADDFQRETGVSRETLDRLQAYAELLAKWNARINLVGRESEPDLWRRHILDSAQLLPLIPKESQSVADIGAGAGLPGLILSVLNTSAQIHLIESDRRKVAFLREAIRVTQSTAIVHESRVEEVDLPAQDVVVARACAPLDRLLEMAEKLISIHTVCLFPKGTQVEQELTAARLRWKMQVRQVPSRTDPGGRILVLTEVARA
ncbi:MAG TPA: 16S rRNA (guanine(527)-N(7))-methyltransferase RsmG [Sphingomicrobium sp.]|nr:16S rRNA (guanine(527)-N(7))-methyltransferase RsmG [Sphingomicrobium sp.]